MNEKEIIKLASTVRNKAYAPYSGFKVGAVVITGNGKVYTGVNIENASYGATNCAERTAIFNAVSDGEKNIKIIAVVGSSRDVIYPCGICRQVIAEFADKNTRILCGDESGNYEEYTLDQLLPYSFDKIPCK